MRRTLLAAFAFACLATAAPAGTYYDGSTPAPPFTLVDPTGPGGGGTGPMGNAANPLYAAPAPFPYTPLCPESHGVSLATAATLTLPTGIANSSRSCVTQAVAPRYCVVTARTATVYYTLDGSTTPTAANSTALSAGSSLPLVGAKQIADFEAFSTTGTLDVECSQ